MRMESNMDRVRISGKTDLPTTETSCWTRDMAMGCSNGPMEKLTKEITYRMKEPETGSTHGRMVPPMKEIFFVAKGRGKAFSPPATACVMKEIGSTTGKTETES